MFRSERIIKDLTPVNDDRQNDGIFFLSKECWFKHVYIQGELAVDVSRLKKADLGKKYETKKKK